MEPIVDVFGMLDEFHEKFGVSKGVPITEALLTLRERLLLEEYDEAIEEIEKAYEPTGTFEKFNPHALDLPNLTKELADLIYVTVGFATTFGLPLKEVFAETHKSNMSKLDIDGKPILREDGKVLKGPNYQPPDIDQFFRR